MAEVSMKMTKVQQEEGTHTLYIQTLTIEGEDSVLGDVQRHHTVTSYY